ncbi:MAG: SRPBCC family protein [Dehalococcoidia bacterium]|nr:SRPBCC family protein [Dehalococcoidia bacterium]
MAGNYDGIDSGTMKFEADIRIKATPQAIWDAVADPETWPGWTKAVYRVKKLSEGPLGVGSRLRIIIWCVIPVHLYATITDFAPGQGLTMEGKALIARLSRYYALKPEDGHTRVIVGGEATGLLAPLIWWIGQALSQEIVHDMMVKVEGSAPRSQEERRCHQP